MILSDYTRVARDNVYNSENDFGSAFTFSVYTNGDESDWLWNRNPVGVGICTHRGGDVRGNYSMPRFFVVDDSIGETGFLYWVLSWYCESGPDSGTVARINDECGSGYASSPTAHLSDILDTSDCDWKDGKAHVETDDGVYVVAPFCYFGDATGEVLDIPSSGDCLHDVCIETDAWIEAVLKSGGREVTEEVYALVSDEHGQDPEWDDSEGVAEAFSLIIGRESCE